MARFGSDELTRIRAEILRQRAERAGSVADGKCVSYETYKHEVGYVAGLDFALEQINKITGSSGDN